MGQTTVPPQKAPESMSEHTRQLYDTPNPACRIPTQEPIRIPPAVIRPNNQAVLKMVEVTAWYADLTRQCEGRPIGQRIILHGTVIDSVGNPVPNALLETWQCNGAGRYRDFADPGELPLDPNFIGSGRLVTGDDGAFRFTTIRPASYAGPSGSGIPYRPAHLHVSVFGPDLRRRLMTQVYFDGDPLIAGDYVIADAATRYERAQDGLIAHYDPETTVDGGPEQSLGYRWNIVLGGHDATPMEW